MLAQRFRRSRLGGAHKVQVGSSPPTRPARCVGHGRGAAYGAFAVTPAGLRRLGRDARVLRQPIAGRQMDILGLSTWLRYLEQHGVVVPLSGQCLSGALMSATWRSN